MRSIAVFAFMFAMIAPLLKKPTPNNGFHCPGQFSDVAMMSAKKCTACHTNPVATPKFEQLGLGGTPVGNVHTRCTVEGGNNTNCAACHKTPISNRSTFRGLQ
jgi:hypothetical protein